MIQTNIGESDVSREIVQITIGDENGVAQEVIAAYIGDENGVAQEVYFKGRTYAEMQRYTHLSYENYTHGKLQGV